MNIKVFLLITVLSIQILEFLLKRKDIKFMPFLAINLYSIKPIIEKYLNFLDIFFQIILIIAFLIKLYTILKNNEKLESDPYILIFLFLILLNGFFNFIKLNTISNLYIQGLTNFLFIMLLIIYLLNSIKSEYELKRILFITRYNIILIFMYSFIDKFILGLDRAGENINPNYLSQACVILILFYLYSTKSKRIVKNSVYILLVIFSVLSTGSNSGQLAILIIIASFLIFGIKSSNLIFYSNYLAWGTMFFFMLIIIYTSNHEFGILKYFVKTHDTSRIVLWQYTFEQFKLNPIMGAFYNSFRAPWGTSYLVTHNDFLRLLAELGFSSILLLFAMVRNQFKYIIRLQRSSGVFVFAFIMITLSFSLSHNNINNFMFWFALILPNMIYRLSKTN